MRLAVFSFTVCAQVWRLTIPRKGETDAGPVKWTVVDVLGTQYAYNPSQGAMPPVIGHVAQMTADGNMLVRRRQSNSFILPSAV